MLPPLICVSCIMDCEYIFHVCAWTEYTVDLKYIGAPTSASWNQEFNISACRLGWERNKKIVIKIVHNTGCALMLQQSTGCL
jgi:hypothetical protein